MARRYASNPYAAIFGTTEAPKGKRTKSKRRAPASAKKVSEAKGGKEKASFT